MGGVFAGKNLRHVLESIRLHCDSVLRRLSPALRYRDNNVRITEDRPTPTKAGIWRLAVASLTGTLDSRRRQVRFCFQYFFYLLCRFFQWRAVLPHGGGHEARPQYTRRPTACVTRLWAGLINARRGYPLRAWIHFPAAQNPTSRVDAVLEGVSFFQLPSLAAHL